MSGAFSLDDGVSSRVIETKLRSPAPNPKCNDSAFASINCVRIAHSLSPTDYTYLASDATVERVFHLPAALDVQDWTDIVQTLDLPIFAKTLDVTQVYLNSPASESESTLSEWFKAKEESSISTAVLTNGTETIPLLRLRMSDGLKTVFIILDCRPSHASQVAFMIFDSLRGAFEFISSIFRTSTSTTFSARFLSPNPGGRDLSDADLISDTIRYVQDHAHTPPPESPKPDTHSTPPAPLSPPKVVEPSESTKSLKDSEGSPTNTRPPSVNSPDRPSKGTTRKRRGEFDWQLSLLNPKTLATPASKPEPAPFKVDLIKNEEAPPEPTPIPPQQNEFACLKALVNATPLTFPIGGIMEDGIDEEGPAPDPPGAGEYMHSHGKAHTETKTLAHSSSHSEFGWQRGLLGGLVKPSTLSSLSPRKKDRPKGMDLERGPEGGPTPDVKSPLESAVRQTKAKVPTSVDESDAAHHFLVVPSKADAKPMNGNAPSKPSERNSMTSPDSGSSPTWDLLNSASCEICKESVGNEDTIKLHPCEHNLCKPCTTSFVESKLKEQKYPLVCPACTTDRDRSVKGSIDEEIVKGLGFKPDQLDKFDQLQLQKHAILLHCPRCKRSANVDREEYAKELIIQCPLVGCGHKWCKACSKTVASSQEDHKCKQSKFDSLVHKKGWKFCPGCHTAVQKESGCNHMTCGNPGCNVHFCYKCGQLIIDTTHGGDITTAVNDHYATCKLFEKDKCVIM